MAGIGKIVYAQAMINAAKAGDRVLVAALANHRIQVHGLFLAGDGVNSGAIRFESAAGGTAMSGVITIGVGSVNGNTMTLPFSEVPWMITDAEALAIDDALSLEISDHTDIDGFIIYSYVRIREV